MMQSNQYLNYYYNLQVIIVWGTDNGEIHRAFFVLIILNALLMTSHFSLCIELSLSIMNDANSQLTSVC